jgi:hypothetical protein
LAEKGRDALLKDYRLPLEILLARMSGDPTITDEMFQAAVAAAPYCHPRLTSSETRISSDNTHRVVSDEPMSAEEWTRQYATPANDAVAGEIVTEEEPDAAAGGN